MWSVSQRIFWTFQEDRWERTSQAEVTAWVRKKTWKYEEYWRSTVFLELSFNEKFWGNNGGKKCPRNVGTKSERTLLPDQEHLTLMFMFSKKRPLWQKEKKKWMYRQRAQLGLLTGYYNSPSKRWWGQNGDMLSLSRQQEPGFESRDYTKGKIPTKGISFLFSRK